MQTSPFTLAAEPSGFSGTALFFVFITLAILAVLILIYSRITAGAGKAEASAPSPEAPAPPAPAAPENGLTADEIEAIALSAVCDDLGAKPEEIAVRSFREIR